MFADDEIEKMYGKLLEDFGAHIRRFCIRRSKNYDDADDLMQEIFIAIWLAMPAFRPDITKAQTNKWLHRLMASVYIKHLRHRQQVLPMPTELLPEPQDDAPDYSLLDELVAELPDDDRTIVDELRQGFNPADVAMIHGLTVGAIFTRMSRIKDRLITIYNKNYGK